MDLSKHEAVDVDPKAMQQNNLIWDLKAKAVGSGNADGGATVLYLLAKWKTTTWEFSKGTAKAL